MVGYWQYYKVHSNSSQDTVVLRRVSKDNFGFVPCVLVWVSQEADVKMELNVQDFVREKCLYEGRGMGGSSEFDASLILSETKREKSLGTNLLDCCMI